MMRFIMPIVLVGIATSIFFVFTNPTYSGITALKEKVASYNTALDNSKALENQRDKLTAKLNTFDPNDITKLEKLLPDSVNNIRLILEIEQIAKPYGMALQDVKYNTNSNTPATTAVVQGGVTPKAEDKNYGVFDLEFSTSGTYDNFINFTKDLESNLRIVDITSVAFSSDTLAVNIGGAKASSADVYKYDFKIKTYWLKN